MLREMYVVYVEKGVFRAASCSLFQLPVLFMPKLGMGKEHKGKKVYLAVAKGGEDQQPPHFLPHKVEVRNIADR